MTLLSNTNAAQFETKADDVFGRIAGRYDVLCDIFSLGIHRRWKQRMAQLILAEDWSVMLDAAAGTGAVSLRVARDPAFTRDRQLIASDISPQMLAVASRKAAAAGSVLDFRVLDAHSMDSVQDNSVDLYAISLGLKICDRHKIMKEAMRVLRPSGRFFALEASVIPYPWLNRLYLTYMNICMPILGWIATGGDASAYRYLLNGIHAFPGAEQLALEMEEHGFSKVSFERQSLGIVAIHSASKPV